jgi:hypothetical protein
VRILKELRVVWWGRGGLSTIRRKASVVQPRPKIHSKTEKALRSYLERTKTEKKGIDLAFGDVSMNV